MSTKMTWKSLQKFVATSPHVMKHVRTFVLSDEQDVDEGYNVYDPINFQDVIALLRHFPKLLECELPLSPLAKPKSIQSVQAYYATPTLCIPRVTLKAHRPPFDHNVEHILSFLIPFASANEILIRNCDFEEPSDEPTVAPMDSPDFPSFNELWHLSLRSGFEINWYIPSLRKIARTGLQALESLELGMVALEDVEAVNALLLDMKDRIKHLGIQFASLEAAQTIGASQRAPRANDFTHYYLHAVLAVARGWRIPELTRVESIRFVVDDEVLAHGSGAARWALSTRTLPSPPPSSLTMIIFEDLGLSHNSVVLAEVETDREDVRNADTLMAGMRHLKEVRFEGGRDESRVPGAVLKQEIQRLFPVLHGKKLLSIV